MKRGAIVLRPEPGNARTAAQLTTAGVAVLRQPLFAVAPADWRPPDPAAFDALLLTSANAARFAGEGLAALAHLPVVAVGEATATAARAGGLTVAWTGSDDAAGAVAAGRAMGLTRLLHLAGHDRIALPGVRVVIVYRSAALPIPLGAARQWTGHVALLHSVRAAHHFAALVDRDGVDRASVAIAAISAAVRDAAGPGWAASAVADHPTDEALLTEAVALIDPVGDAVDKQGR